LESIRSHIVYFYDISKNYLGHTYLSNFKTASDCEFVNFRLETTNLNTKVSLSKTDLYVPYGKWFLPHDYAEGHTPNRFDITEQRSILSDAQTSETRVDI